MTTLRVKDGAGDAQYLKGAGVGSTGDPFVSSHRIEDGDNVAQGAVADVPFVGVEDNTARTGISLWKGIKNVLGITTAAAVVTDAAGTIQQYLRGLVKIFAASLGSGTSATALRTVLATDVGLPAGTNALGSTTDGGPAWTSVWGVSNAPVTSADMSGSDADLTAAPTSGQKWVITDVIISADAAMTVRIKEETSGTIMFSVVFGTGGGFAQFTPRGKRKLAVADKKLVGRTTAAGNVSILVGGYSEA